MTDKLKSSKATDNSPRVSIIIPVYNTGENLKICLDSVFSQTYPNIEVICIDDGSTDDSLTIMQSYQKLHNDMKVIHQENKGISRTRNLGVKKSTGDYIAHIDSDDEIKPDYIATLASAIGENDVVFSGHEKRDRSGKIIYEARPLVGLSWSPYKFNQTCGKLYRRSFLSKHQIDFPPEYQPDEDIYVTMRVLAATNKIKIIDYIGYIVYCNPTSVTHTTNTSKENRNTKTLQCLKDIDMVTSSSDKIPVNYRLFFYLKTVVIHMLLQRHLLTDLEYYQEYTKYFTWLKEIYAKYGYRLNYYVPKGEEMKVAITCRLFVLATKTHTARVFLNLLNRLHIAEIR